MVMALLSLDSVLEADPRVVSQVVGEEAVLVLTDASQVKVLNEVGARIWSLIDGSTELREIAARINEAYQVDLTQAEYDVLEFVTSLYERGIVREVSV